MQRTYLPRQRMLNIFKDKNIRVLVGRTIDKYQEMVNSYFLEDYQSVLTQIGKFDELFFSLIDFLATGVKRKKIVFNEIEKRLNVAISKGTVPATLSTFLVKNLRLTYKFRNSRDGAHINDFIANRIDSLHVINNAQWCLAELIRIYSSLSIEACNSLIIEIIELPSPIIQRFDEKILVLKDFSAANEIMIILFYSENNSLKEKELKEMVIKKKKHSNQNFLTSFNNLEKQTKVYRENGICTLTYVGIKAVQKVIHSEEVKITQSNMILDLNSVSLNWKDFKDDGMRIEVFGQSGAGKSHAAKSLLEQFINWNIPFVVIDPEGEYISFKEITKVLIIGGSYADLPLDSRILTKIYSLLFEKSVNIIFDLSHLVGYEERAKIAEKIQEELFNAATKYRRLFVYLVDETKLIAPQAFRTKSNAIATDIAQRGRKRGFIPIFVMQRPSEVDKGILTQCNIHFMGTLQFPTDLKYIKQLLDDAKVASEDIKQLSQEFFLWTGGEAKKIRFNSLGVKDLGKTVQPGSSLRLTFKSDTSLSKIIEDLNKSLVKMVEGEKQERKEIEKFKHRLVKQEKLIVKLEKELSLERQARNVAKKIDFSVDAPENNNKYQEELTSLKGKVKLLQESINLLSKQKTGEGEMINFKYDKIEYLFPLDIIGVDMRSGVIIGNEISKLLLDQLNSTERILFFKMQNEKLLSKSKIWDCSKEKEKEH